MRSKAPKAASRPPRILRIELPLDRKPKALSGGSAIVCKAGKVGQIGSPPSRYQHPRNLFVAGFMGSPSMNCIAGELVAVEAGHADLKLRHDTLFAPLASSSLMMASAVPRP